MEEFSRIRSIWATQGKISMGPQTYFLYTVDQICYRPNFE
jgi:hypothetical protein